MNRPDRSIVDKQILAAAIKYTYSGVDKFLDDGCGIVDDLVYMSWIVSVELNFGTVKEFRAA
jgi:hypothetical protein